MSVNDAILVTQPTSYWPLDDLSGSPSCHDEMGLHDASLPSAGVTLSVLPFGTSQAPFFDGALKSVLTIPDDQQYSQPFAKALTVSAWLCPLALNNANVVGGQDKYVHYVEKAVAESVDAEWALRFYNQLNQTRHSRLSFYTFNLGSPTGEGNGSYMDIPARYCTGYLGDIGVPVDPNPMDFSAWFEVFLDGRWYTMDARHNHPRIGRIVMGRGRDAADVAMSTAFGVAPISRVLRW